MFRYKYYKNYLNQTTSIKNYMLGGSEAASGGTAGAGGGAADSGLDQKEKCDRCHTGIYEGDNKKCSDCGFLSTSERKEIQPVQDDATFQEILRMKAMADALPLIDDVDQRQLIETSRETICSIDWKSVNAVSNLKFIPLSEDVNKISEAIYDKCPDDDANKIAFAIYLMHKKYLWKGRVWLIGSTRMRQNKGIPAPLGHQHEVQLEIGLRDNPVIKVASSIYSDHSVILFRNGRVITFGDDSASQNVIPPQLNPEIGTDENPVKDIGCTADTSYAILSTGNVVFWGPRAEIYSNVGLGYPQGIGTQENPVKKVAIANTGEFGITLLKNNTIVPFGINERMHGI